MTHEKEILASVERGESRLIPNFKRESARYQAAARATVKKNRHAKFGVEIESEKTFFRVDKEIFESISRAAQKRGVPAGTLANLWLQEKLRKLKVA